MNYYSTFAKGRSSSLRFNSTPMKFKKSPMIIGAKKSRRRNVNLAGIGLGNRIIDWASR